MKRKHEIDYSEGAVNDLSTVLSSEAAKQVLVVVDLQKRLLPGLRFGDGEPVSDGRWRGGE